MILLYSPKLANDIENLLVFDKMAITEWIDDSLFFL